MQVNTNVRKLVVKNFKGQKLPEDFEEESWRELQKGLRCLFNDENAAVNIEVLYRVSETMCRCRLAHFLYSRLATELEEYAKMNEEKVLKSVLESERNGRFLEQMASIWTTYTNTIKTVEYIFLYLDRVYVINRPELDSVKILAILLFRRQAMNNPSIRTTLESNILNAMEEDRKEAVSANSSNLNIIFSMLNQLDLMDSWMKDPILKTTRSFFADEHEKKYRSYNISQYLKFVNDCFDAELLRHRNYDLPTQFSSLLETCLREELFSKNMQSIVMAALNTLIEAEDLESLRLLGKFVLESDNIDKLRQHYSQYIKDRGNLFINAADIDESVISEIISWKGKLERILSSCFEDKKILHDGQKEAFESFLNSRQNRVNELLARYIDGLLKRSGFTDKMGVEEELEASLDKCIEIFRFLQGKDSFESIYKKDLARRLLYSRSTSIELEKSFVNKLKEECGSAFTSRLESMFRDLDATNDAISQYQKSSFFKSKISKMEINTTIISYGIWPPSSAIDCVIPAQIREEQDNFIAFYQSQHKGRVLKYQHSLGHCILRARFPSGLKELQVTIPQALALVQFNDSEEHSFETLLQRTGLDEVNLSKALQSLACGKIQILIKNPKTRDFNRTDKFSFNNEFTSKHPKIRINISPPIGKDSANVLSPLIEAVSPIDENAAGLPYRIDAAVVRILKKNDSMKFAELTKAVEVELRTKLSSDEVEKRLGVLADREFIAKTDSSEYKYLP